jgi:hypothetical protein
VQLNPYNTVTDLEVFSIYTTPCLCNNTNKPSIKNAQLEELNGALTVCYDGYSEDNFDNKRDIFVSDCLFDVKLLEVQTCVMNEYTRRRQFTNEAGKKKEEEAYHSDEI